jgi:hypothetical protein
VKKSSTYDLYFPVNELDGRDLLVREVQQLRLAYQQLQDHILTKEGEVSVILRPDFTLFTFLLPQLRLIVF